MNRVTKHGSLMGAYYGLRGNACEVLTSEEMGLKMKIPIK